MDLEHLNGGELLELSRYELYLVGKALKYQNLSFWREQTRAEFLETVVNISASYFRRVEETWNKES